MASDTEKPADPPGLCPWAESADTAAAGLAEPEPDAFAAAGLVAPCAPWPTEREAIYRLIYQLEARFNQHYAEAARERTQATASEAARRRDATDARAGLAAVRSSLADTMARLNLVTVALISTALFALAGPEGLRQISATLDTRNTGALGLDGMVTIAGVVIPLLYPLGSKIFVNFRAPARRKTDPQTETFHG